MKTKKLLKGREAEKKRLKIKRKSGMKSASSPGKVSRKKPGIGMSGYPNVRKGMLSRIKGGIASLVGNGKGGSPVTESIVIKDPVGIPEKGLALSGKASDAKVRRNGKRKGTGKELMIAPKLRVAIVSLTSCEGCQFVLLDLGERFFDFAKTIELVDFRLIEDQEDDGLPLDLVLVEGNPVTDENVEMLKRARARSKVLAAIGNCAAMGGIPEIRNYQRGKTALKHVYRYVQGISTPEIREIDNLVKVDFVFPGCPIDGEEFLRYVPKLLKGEIPRIPDRAVCFECKKKGNKCLLLEGKPCFGPMILGGCDAVCPSSRMGCQGCRGIRPSGNVGSMKATLKNMMTDDEFENVTEIFGLRDDIEEKEKKS